MTIFLPLRYHVYVCPHHHCAITAWAVCVWAEKSIRSFSTTKYVHAYLQAFSISIPFAASIQLKRLGLMFLRWTQQGNVHVAFFSRFELFSVMNQRSCRAQFTHVCFLFAAADSLNQSLDSLPVVKTLQDCVHLWRWQEKTWHNSYGIFRLDRWGSAWL